MHDGQQLHTTKRLPLVPNFSWMLVWATCEHTVGGGHALQPGDASRECATPCLPLLVLAGLLPPRWVAGAQGEVPSAWILRSSDSVHPVTAIRRCGSVRALRTTTSYEKAFAARPKLVVDVGTSYFGTHERWRPCSPTRGGDSRARGTMFNLLRPRRPAAPLWVDGTQDEVPPAGILRAPCPV